MTEILGEQGGRSMKCAAKAVGLFFGVLFVLGFTQGWRGCA